MINKIHYLRNNALLAFTKFDPYHKTIKTDSIYIQGYTSNDIQLQPTGSMDHHLRLCAINSWSPTPS